MGELDISPSITCTYNRQLGVLLVRVRKEWGARRTVAAPVVFAKAKLKRVKFPAFCSSWGNISFLAWGRVSGTYKIVTA